MINTETLEQQYGSLVDDILELVKNADTYRIVILVVGRPGSGKSTLSAFLARKLNSLRLPILSKEDTPKYCMKSKKTLTSYLDTINTRELPIQVDKVSEEVSKSINNPDFEPIYYREEGEFEVVGRGLMSTCISVNRDEGVDDESNGHFAQTVPMDGFHLPRSVLQSMSNPVDLFKRRGAPWTFDSGVVVSLVRALVVTSEIVTLTEEAKGKLFLAEHNGMPTITAPDFSHVKKDPSPNAVRIFQDTRVVLLEGNYLMLNDGLWAQIPKLVQQHDCLHAWKVENKDKATVRERVARRHLLSGIVDSLASAKHQFDGNDKLNGDIVDQDTDMDNIEKVVLN